MKRGHYTISVNAAKSDNQADIIAVARRRPFYISHSPDGLFMCLTFTFKYQYEAIFRFRKLARRGYWVSLGNR